MSVDFDIKMAQLVEKHPAVYDIMNANYHKAGAKKQAWLQISKEMGIPQSKCEIKWKSLKHQYQKHKKESNPLWPPMEFLRFLDAKEGKTKGRKSKGKAVQREAPMEDAAPVRTQDIENSLKRRTTPSPKKGSSPPSFPRPKRARRESLRNPQANGGEQEISDMTLADTKARKSPTAKQPALSKKAIVLVNADDTVQHRRTARLRKAVELSKVEEAKTDKLYPVLSRLEDGINGEASVVGETPPKRKAASKGRKSRVPAQVSEEVGKKGLYPVLSRLEDEINGEASRVGEMPPKRKAASKGRKSGVPAQPSEEVGKKGKQAGIEENFEKLLAAKLAKVSPAILGTVKASILDLVDKASQH